MPEPQIGSSIGGCEILEVIGHGGMGIIYKARQKSLDRIVAMKVLSPKLANDVNFVGRFQREARAIARVNHPNILAVYDVGTEGDVHYMIMELIEGESLAELQQRANGPLKVEDACRYIRDAAQGLEAAHAGGITHRDIKPENLMITRKGVIKVSDFGLAKEADTHTTSTDAVMGTPAFMSPEQCDGKKVDPRTDIYSLGGTFYKLITGRLPFEAETAMSMMYRHKHEALVPPQEIVPTISEHIGMVVCKMMAKKREQRIQSMSEVVQAIEDAQRGVSGRSAPASPPPSTPPPAEQLEIHLPEPAAAVPPPDDGLNSPLTGQTSMLMRPQAMPPPGQSGRLGSPPGGPPPGQTGRMARPIPMQSGRNFTESNPSLGGIGAGSSSKLAQPGFMAAAEDAFSLAARGDDMLARNDRIGGLKCYRQALSAKGLDSGTRQRLEQELQKEIKKRRESADSLLQRSLLVEAGRELRLIADLAPADEAIKAQLKDIEGKLAQKRTLINDIRTAIAGLQFEKAIKLWESTPLDLRDENLGKQIDHLRTVIVPSQKLAEQGESYIEQGRLEEAVSSFQDALRIDNNCERARRGLGEAEGKLNRIDALLKEGYEHHLKQDYERAIEIWKPIIQLRPGHAQGVKSIVDAYLAMAQARRHQGDLKAALRCYQGAHEADPQNRLVSRHLDEMTDLHDKEQALIDRATDANNHGRTGEAIRYWKEVLRINAANKQAAAAVDDLGKARTFGLVKVLMILAVLGVLGWSGYQFYSEKTALTEMDAAMAAGDFQRVPEIAYGISWVIFGQDKDFLLRKAQEGELRQRAEAAEASGNLPDAVGPLKDLLGLLEGQTSESNEIQKKIVDLESRWALEQGEKALTERNWEEAKNQFKRCQDILRETDRHKEFTDRGNRANKLFIFTVHIHQAFEFHADGERTKAIEQLKLASAQFDHAFVKELKEQLGWDEDLAAEKIGLARKVLDQPWLDGFLEKAQKLLAEAEAAGAGKTEIKVVKQVVDDMAACAEFGMVLVTTYKHDTLRYERDQAFCIDKYENSGRKGDTPQVVSWVEARRACESKGRKLCTWTQWSQACMQKGGFSNWAQPGDNPSDDACNWAGKGVVKSGQFERCYSEVGAFDMNGNLAEWVDDTAGQNAFVAGGHFASGKERATCKRDDREMLPRDTKSPQSGYRCCKPLK